MTISRSPRFVLGVPAALSLLLLLLIVPQQVLAQEEADIQFPPILDSDDISYFFEQRDIDGLHWALSNVFARSARNPNNPDAPPLPEQLVSRGGGTTYTTTYKIQQDLEQAEYLAGALKEQSESKPELSDFFGSVVAPMYRQLLERIPPLEKLERTSGLYPFKQQDIDSGISEIYNKALHHTDFPEMRDDKGNLIPLLNPSLDVEAIQRQWFGEDPNHEYPGIVVIDNILSAEALNQIRQLLLESTVWYQTKLPLKFGGYVGAYIDDGLYDRLLLQLAFELYDRLPRIMSGNFLKYLWAYKYDSEFSGINLHADQARVNFNLWLTPDEANLDPESGGLVIFTAKPPTDWDFSKYNTDTDFVVDQLLKPTDFRNWTVPHRQNRAVMFDSALFHQTDVYKFKKGYENRRINLTLLYGEMEMGSVKSGAEEL